MSKVLCAVDLSPAAEQVMREAGALAASLDAELIVFHAFEAMPLVVGSMPEVLPAQVGVLQDTKNNVRAFLEKTATRALAVRPTRIEVEVVPGSVHRGIVARADALRVSYVVVGAGVHRGLERLLLGAVAEKVVRHAHCPVLVTRPSPPQAPVLAAVDLSPVSRAAVRTAAREARRRRVELVVVHGLALGPETRTTYTMEVPVPVELDTPALRRRARDEMEAWLAAAGVRDARLVIEDGAPVPATVHLAKQLPAGLVVVGTTGRTGLERLLLGSVAEGIVHKAPCSVLAVRLEQHGLAAVPPEDDAEEEAEADELAPLDGGVLRVPDEVPETHEERLERLSAAEEHQEREGKGIRLGKL